MNRICARRSDLGKVETENTTKESFPQKEKKKEQERGKKKKGKREERKVYLHYKLKKKNEGIADQKKSLCPYFLEGV